MEKAKRRTWVVAAFLLAVALLVAACGQKPSAGSAASNGQAVSGANGQGAGGTTASLKGRKIALIMRINLGTFSAQYIDGVKEQIQKFGGEVKVFDSQDDLSKMSSNLNTAVNQHFDGILLDHGSGAALEAGIKKALDAKIPVVAFDTDISLPGVTTIEQSDQKMAELTLDQMAKDIGNKGNIVKVWVAGFPPMEKRQISYAAFLKNHPDIKEVAAFGNANNPALDTQSQMEAVLKKYPNKGDITAVWAAWDEFAKGASRAIQQAGRSEIKVYGIDMSDEDLQMIQDPNSPWVASAAVDPKDIGRVQVRYLYQKLHGDKTDDNVVLDAVFISRDKLPKDKKVTTDQLSQYIPGWGSSKQGYADWMKDLEAAAAAK
jgi:simple sugar transport system substrate-binding protein